MTTWDTRAPPLGRTRTPLQLLYSQVCTEVRVFMSWLAVRARRPSWKSRHLSAAQAVATGGRGKQKNHKEGVSILLAGRAENCIFCSWRSVRRRRAMIEWIGLDNGFLRRQHILAFSLGHLQVTRMKMYCDFFCFKIFFSRAWRFEEFLFWGGQGYQASNDED